MRPANAIMCLILLTTQLVKPYVQPSTRETDKHALYELLSGMMKDNAPDEGNNGKGNVGGFHNVKTWYTGGYTKRNDDNDAKSALENVLKKWLGISNGSFKRLENDKDDSIISDNCCETKNRAGKVFKKLFGNYGEPLLSRIRKRFKYGGKHAKAVDKNNDNNSGNLRKTKFPSMFECGKYCKLHNADDNEDMSRETKAKQILERWLSINYKRQDNDATETTAAVADNDNDDDDDDMSREADTEQILDRWFNGPYKRQNGDTDTDITGGSLKELLSRVEDEYENNTLRELLQKLQTLENERE